MTATVVQLDLPPDWSCRLELQQTADGAYAGKAELREGAAQRCVLVIAQQPSREAALERLKFRAEYFIQEWAIRQRRGAVPPR